MEKPKVLLLFRVDKIKDPPAPHFLARGWEGPLLPRKASVHMDDTDLHWASVKGHEVFLNEGKEETVGIILSLKNADIARLNVDDTRRAAFWADLATNGWQPDL